MKKLILFFLLIFGADLLISQTDTLFSGKKAIPCKIIEIGENEFKYKKADLPDGPVYVIGRDKITKYKLANGYTEYVAVDELSLENEHKEILANRQVIKFQPFGMVYNCISFAYEKVIKVGTNLDVEIGYMNNSMTVNNSFYTYGPVSDIGPTPFTYGFYFKPGMKFFLGQDFSIKGLRYAHPLKGRFIKLDLAYSYLNIQGVTRFKQRNPYWGYPDEKATTDIVSNAFGGFICYGRQFILANVLTLEYYLGFGYSGRTYTYSNPHFVNAGNSSYQYRDDRGKYISRYGGFLRDVGSGISGTAGLRLGYIIPVKKASDKTKL